MPVVQPIPEVSPEVQNITETPRGTTMNAVGEGSEDPSWCTLDKEEEIHQQDVCQLSEKDSEDEASSMDKNHKGKSAVHEEDSEKDKGRKEPESSHNTENQGKDKPISEKSAGRQLVEGNHVWKLVQDYSKYFNIFSKDRKRTLVQ